VPYTEKNKSFSLPSQSFSLNKDTIIAYANRNTNPSIFTTYSILPTVKKRKQNLTVPLRKVPNKRALINGWMDGRKMERSKDGWMEGGTSSEVGSGWIQSQVSSGEWMWLIWGAVARRHE
jgi:hypothetical protein